MTDHRLAWGPIEPPDDNEPAAGVIPEFTSITGRSVSYKSGQSSKTGSSGEHVTAGPADRLRDILQERGVLRSAPKLEGNEGDSYHTRVLRTAVRILNPNYDRG